MDNLSSYLANAEVPGDDALSVHAAGLMRPGVNQVVRVAAHAAPPVVLLPLN